MINQERLINLFLDLVKIDSPSGEEKNVALFLRKLMDEKGFTSTQDNAGEAFGGNCGNVIVHIPATGEGKALAFSAHMDCVQPCIGVEPVINNGVISSSGETVLGGDDKAGIAIMIESILSLEENKIEHPDIYLIFSVCEESGMYGAKNMDLSLLPAKDVVVLDSSGDVGTIIVKAPAKAGIDMTFIGRSAHAGIAPEEGISAIELAANAITNMNLLRIDEETTANLGAISGGAATNIVTDSVSLTAEIRSCSDQKLADQLIEMENCCKEATQADGAGYKFEYEVSYPSLNITSDNVFLQTIVSKCEDIGKTAVCKPTGGGSDANILFGKGYNVVNLGVGMSKVHTVDEFIKIESMVESCKLVSEIMKS